MTTNLETPQPRPKMLKDFLQDNNITTNNNNAFTNHYYYLESNTIETNHEEESRMHADLSMSEKNREIVSEMALPRSRSKSRVATEALGKLLSNAVKAFHASTPPPLTLQRSVSRRLLGFEKMRKKWSFISNKKRDKLTKKTATTIVVVNVIKVKDILRWRSFRNHVSDVDDDEVEELQPLDDDDVGSSGDAPKKNFTDGEFGVTEELEMELPCCLSGGEKWDEVSDVGVALDTCVGPIKDDHHNMAEEEIEQQSPVSILESPFRDEVSDEEFLSSFDQSLANMERTKQRLLQSLQLFESLAGVHEDYDFEEEEEEEEEERELREEDDSTNEVNKNKAYFSRGFIWFTRGGKSMEEKTECMKIMDEQSQWGKFQDERVELGLDLEVAVLKDLLDDILIDFCC